MKDRPMAFGVRRTFARTGRILGVALIAFTLLVGAAIPAAAAELMRVTFVRHGESAGNASGLIDTSTPGPVLTATGQQQAQAVPGRLGVNNYDAIYASNMVRTQLTAGPMSQYLGLPIQVLPGLQEIEAGVFEGTPESQASSGYGLIPVAWALQGNRAARIPGSIDGNEFDARMDGALKTMYDNGDRNPIVFSHGGSIMFWTMMNVDNLTVAQKLDLLRNYPLKNTDYVVVEGNAEDGWTLVNWNGKQFSAERTLLGEVQLQVRTLQRQLAATVKQVTDAFATLNPAAVMAAIIRGVGDASLSIAKFAGAVTNKVVHEISQLGAPPQPAPSTTAVSALASTPNPVTANAPEAKTVTTVPATTNAAVGDAKPKTVASETTAVEAKTPAPSEAPKPEPVEAPKAPSETPKAPTAATDGATDLKDGNKAVPGTTATQHTSTGDKPEVAPSPSSDANTGTAATTASSSESKSEAASG